MRLCFCCGAFLQCGPGNYSAGVGVGCQFCPAGLFGATAGLSSSSCTGPCDAGYACPAGSATATAVQCAAGRYSLGGAGVCTLCPAGLYGASTGLTTTACTAPCPAGRYGSDPGLTLSTCTALCPAGTYGATPGLPTAQCSGLCTAGYACVAGSTSATAALCVAGKFSSAGSGMCKFCSAGYTCPAGSNSSTPADTICPAGKYSRAGDLSCTVCDAGWFGSNPGATEPNCTAVPCPGERHPTRLLLLLLLLGAVFCAVPHYCVIVAHVSAPCAPFLFLFFVPAAGSYCPPGTSSPIPRCQPGKWSPERATFCSDCPAGRFSSSIVAGATTDACDGPCREGYFCPAGSAVSTAMICPAGRFSVTGAGTCTDCPPGR
jgi:hypothetical protein